MVHRFALKKALKDTDITAAYMVGYFTFEDEVTVMVDGDPDLLRQIVEFMNEELKKYDCHLWCDDNER